MASRRHGPSSRPRLARVTLLAALTVASAACSDGPQELEGTLAGGYHFEAQCAYLQLDDDRLSLGVPEGMRLAIEADRPEDDDVTVLDSSGGVVAGEGDRLRVVGQVESLPDGGPCGTTRIVRATELATG